MKCELFRVDETNFGTRLTTMKELDIESIHKLVRDRIQSSIQVKNLLLLDAQYHRLATEVALRIVHAIRHGGKIMLCGNGGSAADSQHLAAEFVGRYLIERSPWPALALNVNSSAVTAIGNDYGYDLVFARQVEALGKPGDVVIGISTSGNSRNVVRALEIAKSKSMFTVALTGVAHGAMSAVADCTIRVPSDETPRIQECHILTGHVICEIAELMMCADSKTEIVEADVAGTVAGRQPQTR
jgi:D-sedoheptulose 7-phosphate isomerase